MRRFFNPPTTASTTVGFAIVVTGLAVSAAAQALSPDEVRLSSRPYQPNLTISAQRNEVQVEVVVRDRKGRSTAGLTQENFQVSDNGKPQSITAFSMTSVPASADALPSAAAREGNGVVPAGRPPRYVVFYFDDWHMLSGHIRPLQLAAERFVREDLGPEDRIAVFTASGSPSLDFTDDQHRLAETLEKLKSHPRIAEFGAGGCPRITTYEAYLIANNRDPTVLKTAMDQAVQCNCTRFGARGTCASQQQAVVRAIAEQVWGQAVAISQETLASIESVVQHLSQAPGTRVLVLGSSGFHTGTLGREIDRIIDLALRSGVVVNSLDATGLFAEDPETAMRDVQAVDSGEVAIETLMQGVERLGDRLDTATAAMADFAYSTGGLFFHNNNDLGVGYRNLAAAPEFIYQLSFSPLPFKADGSFHRLKVKVNAPGRAFPQFRPGYFATKPEAARPSANLLDTEVFGHTDINDIPVAVTWESKGAESGAALLEIQIHVDLRSLPFQAQKDRHVQRLSFVSALFDTQGNFVSGKEGEMKLVLRPAGFERLSGSGINAVMSLAAAKGTYRLRTVVRETVRGRRFAISQTAQIQ